MKIQNLDSQTENLYKEDAGLSIHYQSSQGCQKMRAPSINKHKIPLSVLM